MHYNVLQLINILGRVEGNSYCTISFITGTRALFLHTGTIEIRYCTWFTPNDELLGWQ
jgi:hypothetical protein